MWETMRFCGVDMARRGNRRALVAWVYALLLALWGCIFTSEDNSLRCATILLVITTFVTHFVFGGSGVRGLIKPFQSARGVRSAARNDEMDLQRRDRAHYYSSNIVVALAAVAYLCTTHFFFNVISMRATIMAILVAGLTLPSAILLWSTPDIETGEIEAALTSR